MAKKSRIKSRIDRLNKSDHQQAGPPISEPGHHPEPERTGTMGRPKKEKREKYTTALRPDLKKLLKHEAVNKDISPADLLNSILSEYFKT